MASLAASLFLVTLCFKLPLILDPALKPWIQTPNLPGEGDEVNQPFYLLSPTHTQPKGSQTGPAWSPLSEDVLPDKKERISPEEDRTETIQPAAVPVLEFAEIMPEIEGGLGAYYIQIEYPEEAIYQGIQGSLALTFTVNQDGTTSDILVSSPLHALLDSAAVQALRQTRFIPGRHLGESARIRMRLPVRFQLINSVDSTQRGSLTPK